MGDAFKGFPAAELIYDEGQVVGAMTAPSGLDKMVIKSLGFQEGNCSLCAGDGFS